ncbi:MAG TPA: MoxR family ATPase [Candidatus Polarisedimenticolia bacterium]|nr:MoxR family ATPase [Candidatus Polarisedimenticolia bacterium]
MPEQVARLAEHVRHELSKSVVGQREALDQMLVSILCGGHAILEGVPGVAKTLAVKTLARTCRVAFQRVQCTPDLMPADVTGTNVFNAATGEFVLRQGPVFTEMLLVDEINRTPPRTQAALLEAMEERQVTIDGSRHVLSPFFTVFATQNPIEFEGTYPLPEAQLDRFLMKIRVGYPESAEEVEVLERYHQGFDARDLDGLEITPVEASLLESARHEVGRVRVEPAIFRYVTDLIRRTRDWPSLTLGASPRAAIALLLVAKAQAALEGRDYLIPDDVKGAALPVLRHRLLLKPEADLESITSDQVITDVLSAVEVPR